MNEERRGFTAAGRMNLRPEPPCDGVLQRQLAVAIQCFGKYINQATKLIEV